MLPLFSVCGDPPLLVYRGFPISLLSDFDISGRRNEATMELALERLLHCRYDPTWRETFPNLCVHFTFGTCVPLTTNGDRCVIWDGQETRLVRKERLVGPVGPHELTLSQWNWERNAPKVCIKPEWLRDAEEAQDRADTLFINGNISHEDYLVACSRISFAPPPKRKKGVELAMELLDSLL
jgi:hypothetical protein